MENFEGIDAKTEERSISKSLFFFFFWYFLSTSKSIVWFIFIISRHYYIYLVPLSRYCLFIKIIINIILLALHLLS